MSNKKVILGVAAGVAALAVVGVVCKRRGYFDNISTGSLGSSLKNKLSGLKETAQKTMDQVTGHSSEGAQAGGTDTGSKGASGKKGNSINTGNAGINPATA